MKHLKLFESYPSIDSICNKFGITNWTQNSDGSIDVDGGVNLSWKGLTELPLKFGRVTGYFWCSYNNLKSLEGAPNYVGGDFWCYDNKLTTLEGGPIYVGGSFDCSSNNLVTLDGAPTHVGGEFDCQLNQLISLEGAPIYVDGPFNFKLNPIRDISRLFPDDKSFQDSLDYNYLRGRTIVRRRFQEALEEFDIKIPESIPGWKWI